MNKTSLIQSNYTSILQAILFGILSSVALAANALPQHGIISPFATSAVAVSFGAIVCVIRNVRSIWNAGALKNHVLGRICAASSCVSLGIFLVFFGLWMNACPLFAVLSLTFMPSVAILGRKVLWGEAVSLPQRSGLALSLISLAIWLIVHPATEGWGVHWLPATGSGFFMGNISVFIGFLLLGFAPAIARPADYGILVSAYWSWVSIGAALLTLPLMAFGQWYFFKSFQSAPLFSTTDFNQTLSLLLPCLIFGTTLLCFRFVYLGRSSLILSVRITSFLWTFSALMTTAFLWWRMGSYVSPLHILTVPLHALGVWLARRHAFATRGFSGLWSIP